jgi:hypothetical protein
VHGVNLIEMDCFSKAYTGNGRTFNGRGDFFHDDGSQFTHGWSMHVRILIHPRRWRGLMLTPLQALRAFPQLYGFCTKHQADIALGYLQMLDYQHR